MSVQVIENNGKPEYAVLPYKEYLKLLEAAEDREDEAAVLAYREGQQETFSDEVLEELLNGENPIKVYRKYRGLTQEQLAKKVDKSKIYIAKLEAGDRKGPVELYSTIAEALDLDINMLLTN